MTCNHIINQKKIKGKRGVRLSDGKMDRGQRYAESYFKVWYSFSFSAEMNATTELYIHATVNCFFTTASW